MDRLCEVGPPMVWHRLQVEGFDEGPNHGQLQVARSAHDGHLRDRADDPARSALRYTIE
jgi:hypothetical protein